MSKIINKLININLNKLIIKDINGKGKKVWKRSSKNKFDKLGS